MQGLGQARWARVRSVAVVQLGGGLAFWPYCLQVLHTRAGSGSCCCCRGVADGAGMAASASLTPSLSLQPVFGNQAIRMHHA